MKMLIHFINYPKTSAWLLDETTIKAHARQTSNWAYLFWMSSHVAPALSSPPSIHLLSLSVPCPKQLTGLAAHARAVPASLLLISITLSHPLSSDFHSLSWMISLKVLTASIILFHASSCLFFYILRAQVTFQ